MPVLGLCKQPGCGSLTACKHNQWLHNQPWPRISLSSPYETDASSSILVTFSLPHLCGTLYNGDIWMQPLFCQISKSKENSKNAIWIDCGIHAREWISPAFCLWFIGHVSTQSYRITDFKAKQKILMPFTFVQLHSRIHKALIHLLPQHQHMIFVSMLQA